MLRNIITPIQTWLLSQKRCVGCGASLSLATEKIEKKKSLKSCKCGRMYVYDTTTKKYRRALLTEI